MGERNKQLFLFYMLFGFCGGERKNMFRLIFRDIKINKHLEGF